MKQEQLKILEGKLWDAANSLRAYGGLKASDYAVPVLGIIFLKFADNKYSQNEWKIKADHGRTLGTRAEQKIEDIALATCGFYLPNEARFDHLLKLPGDQSMAKALRHAMEEIEKHQDAKFQDVLPKEAYFDIEKKKSDILPQLIKAFSDIPEDASGDVFGKIYEYFLGKFAMSEGQKGGEFFTPTSVVRFIVEVIEPYSGKIYDPACGSGGMFVQSARFVEHENHDLKDIYVYGQEYMGETVRLAKMNLLVNNLRGEIVETNSYANDPHESFGKFDYVMANPPFNVKSVKESTVKDDQRFYYYGLPKNKGKKDDKISDANYLWVSLFATSLNEKGRAGFVMPNSASDARNAEYDIRKKIVDSGIVDCMVSMPSNMFLTVTLPATLWFFDQQKAKTDRKDKILFIDARNVYHQIDRAHREWTEEQQHNLTAIVRLYRGEQKRYLELIQSYLNEYSTASEPIDSLAQTLREELNQNLNNLTAYLRLTKKEKRTAAKATAVLEIESALAAFQLDDEKPWKSGATDKRTALKNDVQLKLGAQITKEVEVLNNNVEALKKATNQFIELFKKADKNAKLKNDKVWTEKNLVRTDKRLEESLYPLSQAAEKCKYWQENIAWLQKRFPKGEYQDVVGLCKLTDKTEYAEEQDYSLNAGRYVGVEIEDDKMTEKEFKLEIKNKAEILKTLKSQSEILERSILKTLTKL